VAACGLGPLDAAVALIVTVVLIGWAIFVVKHV
jgi:hypothetical protein